MVASVLALAEIEDFVRHVSRVLLADGAATTDDGHMATFGENREQLALIYWVSLSSAERQGLDRLVTATGLPAPDLTGADAVVIETRWPAEVARLGRVLAAGVSADVWLIDSNDVAWRSEAVDPDRVAMQ